MANHTANDTRDGGSPDWSDWLQWDWIGESVWQGLIFVGIIVGGYLAGKLFRWLFEKTLRGYPTSAQLLVGKLMIVTLTSAAALLAMNVVYEVRPFSLLATLGIVSLALGFGLQNTVANLAAGVGLTLDKPFNVGDRIRVGETWGDVTAIGLRSTRILTVNGDLVVIPNSILDTRELWNFTYDGNTKFRLDLPISVSYESSVPLAESLMLKAARSHPQVVAYPEPVVRHMGFGDSSVNLQLRCWISRAQNRPAIRDRLFRSIQELFNEEGVTFPYPQRTVSYLKELEHPSPTPDFLKGEASSKPVVLVCTRSREAARAMAEQVVEFVERLDARMVVLHVRKAQQAMSPYEAQAAVNIYMDHAQRRNIPVRGQTEVGDFPKVLKQVVRETGAKLVLFGKPHTRWLGVGWVRSEVQEAKLNSPVPVVLVDTHETIPEELVQEWHDFLHPPDKEDEDPHDAVAHHADQADHDEGVDEPQDKD